MSDLTTRGTPRKRPARPGEGAPRKPPAERRTKRFVYLSDQQLRKLGWDGTLPVGGFLQRLLLATP